MTEIKILFEEPDDNSLVLANKRRPMDFDTIHRNDIATCAYTM
jgi:hypothetical protein